MKGNVLIVDDEHSGRTSLKILLNKNYEYLFNKIITASSLDDAIEIVSKETFDICFLDIELANQNGFDLLPYLPRETVVVFVTAYSEYAIKAIKQQAFDYLVKPLNPTELKICINRYTKTHFSDDSFKNCLLIKSNGANVPLPLNEIEYLIGSGPYSKVYSINKTEYTTAKTLKTLIDTLGNDFIRIHKSYIVNKTMIKSFKKNSLTTIHNTCLPVSRVGTKKLAQHF